MTYQTFIGAFFSAAALMASAAHADVFFGTSGNLSANADISTVVNSGSNTSTITVILTNTTTATADAGDSLTGITIPGSDSFTTSMITGRSGLLTLIDSDGLGTVPAGTFDDWGFEEEAPDSS